MRQFELLAMFGPPAGTEQDPKAAMLQMIVTFGILGVMFYFLLIRPQQKRQKEHKQMLANLQKGDTIFTAGGLRGKITGIDDAVITLEIADRVRVKVNRSAVGGLVSKGDAAPELSKEG